MVKYNPGKMVLRESPLGDGEFFLQLPKAEPGHPYDIEFMGDDDNLNPYKKGDAVRTLELWNAALGKSTATAVTAINKHEDVKKTLRKIISHSRANRNPGEKIYNMMSYAFDLLTLLENSDE